MKFIIFILTGVIALSCVDPQSAAKDKAKLVQVMADQIAEKFSNVPQVTIENYLEWKSSGEKVVLVDVRPEKERVISMIPDAISLENFEAQKEKYKDHKVVTYCTIGYRSSEYAKKLNKKNFNSYNLKESLLGWAHRGFKFEKNGSPTTKAHVYEKAWNFLPRGYQGVTD